MKILLYISLLLSSVSFAENVDKIDSLRRLISNGHDTSNINIYNQIAWEYRNSDLALTDSFAHIAINISNKINYSKGIGQGYICLALVERNAGNYQEAIAKSRWALLQFVKINHQAGYSSAYNTIASINHIQGNYAIALYYYFLSLNISESL